MGRTWLLRGGAVAVFAVLVGAWGVGFADLDGSSPASEKPPAPVSPDDQPTLDGQRWVVRPEAGPRRTREPDATQAALTGPSPDTVDVPTSEAPDPPPATSTTPTPDPGPPPSSSPDPSPTPDPPSNPPSEQPAEECTDLGAVIDCALDPVTGGPRNP